MNWRVRSPWVAVLVAMLATAPALAQTRDDHWKRCADIAHRDVAIASCSALIRAGGQINANLATIFFNRATAYGAQGDADRALTDLDQAIKLNKLFTDAIVARGNIYLDKGQSARAMQDFDWALREHPYSDLAFYSRGNAHARKRAFDEAIQDYDRSLWINPSRAEARTARCDAQKALGRSAEC